MTSPAANDPRQPSLAASPQTGLLPSPLGHSDEAIEDPPQHGRAPGHLPGQEPLFEADDYVEPQNGSLMPPPDFTPFFTMITDAERGETYHPSTYYVFADDEPDMLSAVALHALETYSQDAQHSVEAQAQRDNGQREEEQQQQQQEEERYILVSLGPEGTNVVSAKSLAPNWAVTNADIRPAPTFDGDDEHGSDGLMLVVQGLRASSSSATGQAATTQRERHTKAKDTFDEARRKGSGSIVAAMEDMAQEMMEGMRTLDKITSLD